jgi:hypothetical protein
VFCDLEIGSFVMMTKKRPGHEVDEFLRDQPDNVRVLVRRLRELIFSISPSAAEHTVWQELSYEKHGEGGAVRAGICQIGVRDGQVRLAFVHGAFLPDPKKLLRGNAKYKRFVPIRSEKDIWAPALRELLQASLAFDPADNAA